MKKVLVTGATGFIGGYVIKILLQKGFQVIASSSSNEKAQKKEWFSKVDHVELDLRSVDNKINYFKYFNEPDLVIHLAWEGLPNYKGEFHSSENLPRHKLFLENLLANGLSDLTVVGTCLEYGLKEGCLSEDMNCEPVTEYGFAKNELRKYLEIIKDKYSFNFKWVRLFYMYGQGQNANSLLSQLDAALDRGEETFNMSGGEQKRDYLPVNKVAEYLVFIATQNEIKGIINCASGKPVKVKDFVDQYLQENSKTIHLNLGFYSYPAYEPMRFWGDTLKLTKVINRHD